MNIIQLTQGHETIVDDEDYESLKQNRWCYHGGYAVRGQRKGLKINKLIRMHAQIMGTPKGKSTDHINGDRLDNRRENLRIVTKHQNGMNHGINKNNTSGYKGVCKISLSSRQRNRLWSAHIKHKYRTIFLGNFDTPEEAAKAYNEAALKYHGEFARLNVIQLL